MMLAVPEKQNGKYEVVFFSHGIRHLPEASLTKIKNLKQKDRLYLMKDIQNEVDPHALVLRAESCEIVGYCPKFFVEDFNGLIEKSGSENVFVSVEKANSRSLSQFKLLCKITTDWPEEFSPFEDDIFQTITSKI